MLAFTKHNLKSFDENRQNTSLIYPGKDSPAFPPGPVRVKWDPLYTLGTLCRLRDEVAVNLNNRFNKYSLKTFEVE